MAATPAEEFRPAEARRMAGSTYRWTGTTTSRAVTHLCPRGSVMEATGLGPDWSEERDLVRSGLERAEGADIWRARSIRATDQECVVESEWCVDPGHVSDRDNGIFPVTDRTLFKGRDGPRSRSDYTPWIPRLHIV